MRSRRHAGRRAEAGIGILALFLVATVGLMTSVTANRLVFLAWTATALLVLVWALRPRGPGARDPRALGGFALTVVFWSLCVQRHEDALHTGGRAMNMPSFVMDALTGNLPILVAAVLGLGATAISWRRRTTMLPSGDD